MAVKGLGGDSDTRPVEMIHADADAAFKMLDTDGDGTIDNEELRKHLYGRGYTEELVTKVFSGIDVDSGGDIDADATGLLRGPPWRCRSLPSTPAV